MNNKTKRLFKTNRSLLKDVSETSQKEMTDLICYLSGANISEYDQELVLQDILDMVLSAQNRGECIQTILGEDFKQFCDEVIANLPPKTIQQKVIDILDIFCHSIAVLSMIFLVVSDDIISRVLAYIQGKPSDLHVSITTGTFLSMIVIPIFAVWIVNWVMKNSFHTEERKNKMWKGCITGLCCMIAFLLIQTYGKAIVFTLHIYSILIIVVILYLAHKVLQRL